MKFVLFHHGLPTYVIFLLISYQNLVVFVQTTHYDNPHNQPSHLMSSHPDIFHQDAIHDHESHIHSTYIPESHTDTSQQPESHNDALQYPESHNDAPQNPESHNDTHRHRPESHNDTPQTPESHNDQPHAVSQSHIREHILPESHNDPHRHPESHNDPHHHPESHNDVHQHPESHNDTPQTPESHNDQPREVSQSHIHESYTDTSSNPTLSNDLTHGSQPQETTNIISIITKNLFYRYAGTTTRIPYSKLNHTKYWPFNMERVRLPPGYQSPINIHTSRIEKIEMPLLDTSSYEELDESAELICFNTGQTIECKVKNGTNAPYIQGGPLPAKYIFDNVHWHWGRGEVGSEHLIDGIPYAAEVHVVHYKEKYGSFEKARKKQDGLAIFALFAKISNNDNPDLEIHFKEVLQHMLVPSKICPSKWHDVFKFIHKIVLNNQQWMTYPGSLTSAPYKESVTWLVYFQCFDISLNQLDALRSTLTTDGHKHAVHRRPVYNLGADNRPMLVRKSQ